MPAILTRGEDQLELNLSPLRGTPAFEDARAKAQEVPGRRFDWDRKLWCFPEEAHIAERLIHSIQPQVDEEVVEWVRAARTKESQELTTILPDDADLLIPWANERMYWQPEFVRVGTELHPFNGLMKHQRPMVEIMAHNRKIINASDMGLGKCAMALSAVAEFLLLYRNEQNRLGQSGRSPGVSEALQETESGTDSSQQSNLSRQAQGGNQGHYRQEEDGALRGLQCIFTSGVHGPGSRERTSAFQHWPLAEHSAALWKIAEAGSYRGISEVRGTVSKLPPAEALAGAPKLIICPTSVIGTWQREIKLWLGEDSIAATGSTLAARKRQIQEAAATGQWCIVNWEQVRAKKKKVKVKTRTGQTKTKTVEEMKEPLFEEIPWLVVIADEVHRAKNRKAQQTRGLWRCQAPLMFALSGTPLMNSPDELWAILHWLWPKEYTSYWRFYEQYVDYYEGYFGKVITGVKNPDALRFELNGRLIRKTQGQVLDLPGKGRIRVDIELTPKQRKIYDEAEKSLWLEVEQAIEQGDKSAEKFAQAAIAGKSLYKIPNGAARTTRLRQILETPANLGGEDESAVLDVCVERILDSRPEQWVVFCEFKPTVECLIKRLEKHGLAAEAYTGDVDPHERAKLEDRFQAGQVDCIVGTLKSMYQGITLTAGNRQFWVSRDWTPDINEQGESRQNRIGQDRRVMVFIAQPLNTVATDKVEPLNRLKERIVRTVLPKDEIKEEVDA